MRSFVALLVIVGLLFCPYNCAVKAELFDAQTAQKKTCLCCMQGDVNSPLTSPNSPESTPLSDDGLGCVCDGVVYDSAHRTQLEDFSLSLDWAILDVQPKLVDESANFSARLTVDATPAKLASGGRQLRIVMLSFLL